jgi:hypothetical protein
MLTCRDIPPEDWAKAQERLVYYFSRGHQAEHSRDLAQETLMVVLQRDDFQFERREDFLPVCLGFARRISQSGYRKEFRYSGGPPTDELPGRQGESAEAVERGILLAEILEKARAELRSEEYNLILDSPTASDPQEGNRRRVARHRALRKLARALGLTRKEP